jgi:hypothetical protein
MSTRKRQTGQVLSEARNVAFRRAGKFIKMHACENPECGRTGELDLVQHDAVPDEHPLKNKYLCRRCAKRLRKEFGVPEGE